MKTFFRMFVVLCCAGIALLAPTASAQVDFQPLLDNLDEVLGAALTSPSTGENLWTGDMGSTPIWTLIPGQDGPTFNDLADNDDNNILDDDHFALLEGVLDGTACLAGLPAGAATAITNAFNANRATIQTFEIALLTVTFDSNNEFLVPDQNVNVTTFQQSCLNTLIGAQCFDVPSLWTARSGPDGLLASIDPALETSLIELGAAVMTIGDPKMIDWWQALTAQVVVGAIPILIDGLLAGLKSEEALIDPFFDISNDLDVKYTLPWAQVPAINQPVSITDPISISGTIRITQANLCSYIQTFINRYNCTTFNCQTARLAETGNLNNDARTNVASAALSGGNRSEFLLLENVGYRSPITILNQPLPPPSGFVNFGASHNMSVNVEKVANEPYTYQWYSGNTSGALTPVGGANASTFNTGALNECLGVGGFTGSKFYRVDVNTPCGGSLIQSDEVEVVVNPPAINITQQPASQTVDYDDTVNFTVTASIPGCGPLSYAWSKDAGPTIGTSSTLTLNNVTDSDEGTYTCVITADGYAGVSIATTGAVLAVNDPMVSFTLQPIGGNIVLGTNYSMTATATIPVGGINYQWYKNGSPTGVTTTNFDIINAQPGALGDSGTYFLRATSDTFPGVSADSSPAIIVVGTGSTTTVYVDKNAPGVQDGTSWEDAFLTIQEGIDAAELAGGGEVWVAGGPTPGGNVYDEARTESWGNVGVTGSLVLKDFVEVYGGFEGYLGKQEATRFERGVHNSVTIIDGSVARGGSAAFHTVAVGNETTSVFGARLDGFHVIGGDAAGPAGTGAATAAEEFHTWRGGGLYVWGSVANIANCTFYGNNAEVAGGAVATEAAAHGAASAIFENCVFWGNNCNSALDNIASGERGGGAVYNDGGFGIASSSPSFNYCTFYGNTTPNGVDDAAMLNARGATVTINNSIFWNNVDSIGPTSVSISDITGAASAITYSDTQGGLVAGTGNISTDPLFATTGPTFFLTGGSPCVETGDVANPAPANDLTLAPRPQQTTVDMGAYEYVPNIPSPTCQPATIAVDAAGNATLLPASIFNVALSTVDGGVWDLLADGLRELPFDCTAVGTPQSVTLTVVDFQGQTGTCLATVTVEDNIAPNAVCQNITVGLVGGTYTLTAGEVDGGSTDNCATNLSIPPTTFGCGDVGDTVNVTLTVTDDDGNSDTCVAQVTVEDNEAPTMICQNISVDLSALGTASIIAGDVDNGSFDDCGLDTLSVDIDTFDCGDIAAPVAVTLTGTDVNGNSDTCVAQVTVNDVTPPTLALNGSATLNVVLGGTYTELGATGTDVCDGDVSGSVSVGGDVVDTGTVGAYIVTYDVSDSSGNIATQITRTVNVIADNPPVITILGSNPVTLECGDSYTDAGATASDVEDGDLTSAIVTTGLPVNTAVPNVYLVTYTVQDTFGTIVSEDRTVNVLDTINPVLTLTGPAVLGLEIGDTYTEQGATAADSCEGDLTGSVVIGGDVVNTGSAGTYVVTYDVQDASGNDAVQLTRTVIVVAELLNFTSQPNGARKYVDEAPFDITAEISGGDVPTTYQWFRVPSGGGTPVGLGVTPVSGSVLTTTVDPAAVGVGLWDYYVEVTDGIGVTSSTSALVEIANHLSFLDDLEDTTAVDGSNFTWSVNAQDGLGAISYQWLKDDGTKVLQPLTDGGTLSGTQTNALNINPIGFGDAGSYQVVASDDFESAPSSTAALTVVNAMPVAGAAGLALMTLLSALGGAAAIRRKRD